MVNLREQAESDLGKTLEGEFALPVILFGPDGFKQEKSANDPDSDLAGQILYDTVKVNPDTGEEIVVNKPVVTLRRSSLDRIPLPEENWIVKIPISPSVTATKQDFMLSPTRPPEGGTSIGFIRLYLQRIEQSS